MAGLGGFMFECAAHHTDRVQAIVQLGEQVWSCSSSGGILVHDRRGNKLQELQIPSRGLTLDYATCLAVVEGREVWCGLSSGGVCVYRDGALAEEMPDGHKAPVSSIAWSERAKTVWTGGGDHVILGWSVPEKKRASLAPLEGHTDWVRCLLVCNGRLWSGSDDKTIRMWPEGGSPQGEAAAVVELHRGGVLSLARVGDAVWSGGADRQICRFDLAGSEKAAPLTAHKGRVTALAACGGRTAWSGSSDRRCLVWSLATQRVLAEIDDFGGAVGAMAAVDGWCVWTGSGDGRLRCWMGAERPPEKEKSEPTEEARVAPAADPPAAGGAAASPRVTLAFSEEDEEEAAAAAAREQRQARRRMLQNTRVSMSPIRRPANEEHQGLHSEDVGPPPPVASQPPSFRQSPRSQTLQRPRFAESPVQQAQPATQFAASPLQHTLGSPMQQQQPSPQQQQQLLQPQQQPQFVAQPPSYVSYPPQSFYHPPLSFYQPAPPAPAPAAQPQTIIIAPPPQPPAPQSANNDGLVAHLRESYQQLRNAYLTLQEKHELLRDQHHRQLSQVRRYDFFLLFFTFHFSD
jgi:hypothetical protein